MRKLFPVLILIISSFTLQAQSVNKLKKELLNSLEQKSSALISVSDNIWEAAELAFREEKICRIFNRIRRREWIKG